MKITCCCGEMVFANPDSRDYCWMPGDRWTELLDTIDREIEAMKNASNAEQVIMKIRAVAASSSVWKCRNCGRLMTLKVREPVFLRVETSTGND